MSKKRSMALLTFIIVLIGNVIGCDIKHESTFYIASISSYRDIPGITEEEINAIEALKDTRKSFYYASMSTRESFMLPDGTYAGFTEMFCKLLSGLFDIPFVQENHEWTDLKSGIDNGIFDFTGEFTPTAERRQVYFMTEPIVQRSLGFITYGDSIKINTERDFNGLRVGTWEGTITAQSIIDAYPELDIEFVTVADMQEVEMLKNGGIDVHVYDAVISHMHIDFESINIGEAFPLVYTPVSFTTANEELKPIISVVDKYFAVGGMNILHELYKAGKHEYGKYLLAKAFSGEEKAFLDGLTAKIPVVMEVDNYPVSFYNENNKEFQGIAVDVLVEITLLTDIEFEVINDKDAAWTCLLEMLRSGEAALVSELLITQECKEHYIWSEIPYFSSQYVFLSKNDYPYLEMYQVSQVTVGVVCGSSYEEMYNYWFPNNNNLITYELTDHALDALEKGEIDLLLTAEYSLLYQLNYREKSGYKTNLSFSVTADSYFGLNKEEELLCSIISKAMFNIDTEKISKEWVSRIYDYSHEVAKSRFYLMILIAASLSVIIILLMILFLQNSRKRKLVMEQNIQLNVAMEQAEEARRESKKALDNTIHVLNSGEIMIFASDLETNEILFITDCWIEHHGIEGNVIGKPCYEAFHGTNKRCTHCPRHKLDAEPDVEVVWEDNYPIVNKIFRKTDRYIDWSDGRKVHIQFATDITEIKQMEIEVAKANERIKLMLDSTPLCCQIWDRNVKTIDCNEACVKLYGFKDKKEYMDRFHDLSPEYQPNGQRSDEQAVMSVKKAFDEGYYVFEWMHQLPDGTPIPAEITLVRVSYGSDYVIAGYTRDLREHKKMMNDIEYRDNLLHATNLMAVLLLNASLESFENNLFQSMSLLAEATQVDRMYIWKNYMVDGELYCSQIGNWSKESYPRYFKELEDGISYSQVIPRWGELLSRGETINNLVRDMPPEEQALITIQGALCIMAIPIFMEENFWGFVSFADCHKERVFSAEEISIMRSAGLLIANAMLRNEIMIDLREASERATVASKAKGDFLSSMSHEMRTPMNAIIGMTAIGIKAEGIEQKNHALNKIDAASSHLLGVINDVLDMAKIEANKLELVPVEYNFERMLQKVLTVMQFRMDEKQQQLTVNVDSNVPHFLIGDDQRLAQVITNLLSNAIKFTPEGGQIRLHASLSCETGENCELRIEVDDSGIGISPEQQEKLFIAFEQGESGISRQYGGTGLGLVISKSIVDLMDGNIWVVSEPGKGARFIFTVKMRHSDKNPRSMLAPGVNWKNVRILAVDDMEETRDQMKELFAQLDIICDVAVDGFEACRIIEERGAYDIYFIDWRMPGMDGIELARKIKESTVNKPSVIIMITVMDWEQIKEDAIHAGVSKCLIKPLLSSTVIDSVNECLGIPDDNDDSNVADAGEFGGKTLLLAEDVEINREIFIELLKDTGLTIDCAENGKQALEMIEAAPKKYDIIFMDMQMPEMNGLEATMQIRALPDSRFVKLPIIAMTANVFKNDIENCLSAGMDDHLGKPIDIDKVLETLRKYIKKPDSHVNSKPKKQLTNTSQPATTISPRLIEVFKRDANRSLAVLERIAAKNGSLTQDDIETYIITVHGMRSALVNIKEMELSADAHKLEMAGENGNIDNIIIGTPILINSLRALIHTFASEDEPNDTTAISDDEAYLFEKLRTVKKASEEYDTDTMAEVLDELRGKTWTPETKEMLNTLDEYLLFSDFDAIVADIEKRLAE